MVVVIVFVKTVCGSEWVTYEPGSLNIILSAPHGGYEEPSYMKERDCGTMVRDSYTQETTVMLADALAARAGGRRPHVIINRLHRLYLDANREIVEAVCAPGHHPEQEEAYYAFQDAIAVARGAVAASYPRGFYIDMHGQSHEEEWQEFGYLLTAEQLDEDDVDSFRNETSIRTLANTSPYRADFDDIIHGEWSLGTMMQRRGYKSVPSADYPGPGDGGYFSGGYNTRLWGSLDGGVIDGVQLEMPFYVREEETRGEFTDAFADVVIEYMTLHGLMSTPSNLAGPLF